MPERSGAWVVIFISRLRSHAPGYAETARRLAERVRHQPGFLGMESWRDAEGRGVTISWWESREAITRWRRDPAHAAAIARAADWYEEYRIIVCRAEEIRTGPARSAESDKP